MLSNQSQNVINIKKFKKMMDAFYDGEPKTVMPLLFIRENYKEWPKIYRWLYDNKIFGKKLVEFFQNESPDGGGVHMGVTKILSRIKGHKHFEVGIKADELK